MDMVFVFDGDCAFCSACADFIRRRIPTPAKIEPWQWLDLAPLGLERAACQEAVQWVTPAADGTPVSLQGPEAIAALLRSSTPMWRSIGWILGRRPVLWLAWPVYRWVSRHRDRMPGGTPACAVPQHLPRNASEA
jgi:predicted DCC family thiol-disulfide oxidoreductase YuxK